MKRHLLLMLLVTMITFVGAGCASKDPPDSPSATAPDVSPSASSSAVPDTAPPAGTSSQEGESPDATTNPAPSSSSTAPAGDDLLSTEPTPATDDIDAPIPDAENLQPDGTLPPSTPEPVPASVPSTQSDPALVKIDAPAGLAAGETVEASDAADLDGDGILERVYLIRTAGKDLLLQVSSGAGKGAEPVRRKVIGPEGEADLLHGPVVSALMLESFGDTTTRDIAIGFAGLTYGDSQWALYRHLTGEPLKLMRLEPFAVDTGIIALRDEDGDGRFERLQYPGHVVRVHRYEESVNGYALVHVRSFSTETFNRKEPISTAQAWLYFLYNRIEPDYARLMGLPDMQDTLAASAERPDLFIPYASWDVETAGTAFLDSGVRSWQGLPSAEATLLKNDGQQAVVRLSHESEFDETRRASVLLRLSKGADGSYKVTGFEQEIAATICLATDENNEMVIHCTPVYMPAAEASSGFASLRKALSSASGLLVTSIRQDGSTLYADLPEAMRLYLNQGSTGSAMRVNTLARSLLSLPGARSVRFTIAGEADVEMDHYSFRGAFTLDENRALQLVDTKPQSTRATQADTVAEALFSALHSEEYDAFARYGNPDTGVTLAIYGFIAPTSPVFDNLRWLSIPYDERVQTFGFYDGSGFPIQETAAEWLHMFFVPHSERSEWERSIETGPSAADPGWPTPEGTWPDATRVTFRWAGSPQYDGMDWRSLTFVLMKTPEGWTLVGLVSNQWTI